MRNLASKRHPIAAFLIALAVLATPALLFAHARLVRSDPAEHATVTTAPTSLSLWFSEKPEVKFTSIQLTDSAGGSVQLGAIAAAPSNGVTVPIVGAVKPGRYTVAWKTAASDGHPTSGKYDFSVVASVTVTPGLTPVPAMRPDTTFMGKPDTIITHKSVSNSVIVPQETATFSTSMRWAELLALLSLVGLVIFRLAVLPVSGWSPELVTAASERAARFGRALLVLFAVATLSRGLTQASLMPAFAGTRFAALSALVQSTRWGMFWAVGVVGLIVVIVGFLLASKAIAGWILAAVGLVAIALSEALTGHSGAVPHAAAAIAADVAHLLGAGGWLGGLMAVLLCGLPILRRLDAEQVTDAGAKLVRAYHGSAMECVIVVVLSAIIASWTRLPTVNSLWTTPYGLALLRKLIFVVVVLGFGFYHWRRVVLPAWTSQTLKRFRMTAAAELVFGAVVIAFTAYLLSQPLP